VNKQDQKTRKRAPLLAAAIAFVGALSFQAHANAASILFSDSGADAASIQGTVDAFRNQLGVLNAPNPVSLPDGRRQINWDAAPDGISAPNAFPGDFFNFTAAPRARGIEFSTPGSSLQLSATAASGQGVEFDNINPTYSTAFQTFSPERLFTPVGSNIVDVEFFLPSATSTRALTDGLGVVFVDVDLAATTKIEFFGLDGSLLTTALVPTENNGLSFVGVAFDTPELFSARIILGDTAIGPNDGVDADIVVMDDFIFGEPQAVPEPVTLSLLAVGLAGVGFVARRRKKQTA
jgi:hypothetical protein